MKKIMIRTVALLGFVTIGLSSCLQVDPVLAAEFAAKEAARKADAAHPELKLLVTEDYMTGLKITAYNGTDADFDIPATKGLKDIISIGENAFKGKSLANVTIPDTIVEIGASAFADNALTTIALPSGLTTLGAGAFSGNSIAGSLDLSSLTSIEASIFAGNALTAITLPSAITSIGASAFSGNNIAGSLDLSGITSIGASAFANNALTAVTFDSGITSIGASAFVDNALTDFTFPASLTSIGANAFAGNPIPLIELTELTPPSITIGVDAFKDTDLHVPNNTVLDYQADVDWNGGFPYIATVLTTAVVTVSPLAATDAQIVGYSGTDPNIIISSPELAPSGRILANINTTDFSNKGLTSVILPDTLKYGLVDDIFKDNDLTTIDLPAGVTSIGDRAFLGNPLTSVTSRNSRAFTVNPNGFPATVANLYVPSAYVATYQASTFWNGYFTTISAIPGS